MTELPADDPTHVLRRVWRGEAPDRRSPDQPEFIGIREWARRLGLSADSAYKAARLGQIPGCFAIGRLYRVNWTIFVRRAGDAPAAGRDSDVEVAQEPTVPAARPPNRLSR